MWMQLTWVQRTGSKVRKVKIAQILMFILAAAGPLAGHTEPARPLSEAHAKMLQAKLAHDWAPTNTNATQMQSGLDHSTIEYEWLSAILETSNNAEAALDHVLTLAIIYQRLRCSDDRSELLNWLPGDLKHAKGELDSAVETANQALANLTAPAVISEAQKLRDLLQYFRQDLSEYSY